MEVKYNNKWYDVLDTRDFFGSIFYAIEDECRVKWLKDTDVEKNKNKVMAADKMEEILKHFPDLEEEWKEMEEKLKTEPVEREMLSLKYREMLQRESSKESLVESEFTKAKRAESDFKGNRNNRRLAMAHLIDKDRIVAEIKRRIEAHKETLKNCDSNISEMVLKGSMNAYQSLLHSLDTLEVKEVDLDGERRKYLTEHFNVYEDGILQSKRSNLPLDTYDVIKIAKHFFELGLSVNNPVTAADRGTAEEIIINLKRVEQDYHIDLTKEMEWVRNQVKKGEEV